MLVLTRRYGESVLITLPDGRTIQVQVVRRGGAGVKLGITAPADVVVDRREAAIERAKRADAVTKSELGLGV